MQFHNINLIQVSYADKLGLKLISVIDWLMVEEGRQTPIVTSKL